MNKRFLKIAFIIALIAIVILLFFLFNPTFSSFIDNNTSVDVGSTLTYYIDIIYDGKDKNVVMSSDSATAEVFSDYIIVTDTIPKHLKYLGIVHTNNGSIGAVKRDDSGSACLGYVYDGVDGIFYDEDNNAITFAVRNLQAGCKITVGIKTKVLSIKDVNATRMDFYNAAFGCEGDFCAYSNTSHVFTGNMDAVLHTVSYSFSGDVPNNLSNPSDQSYEASSSVSLVTAPQVFGYEFSGWYSDDVEISDNNTFVMPNKDVVIVGEFTKNDSFSLTYEIEGDKPSSYVVPKQKSYKADELVKINSLKEGDIIDGYKFLGWNLSVFEESESCVLEESDEATTNDVFCSMLDTDIVIKGKFEKIDYKVSYQFRGDISPGNNYLPEEKYYTAGDEVELANIEDVFGYKFLGWYSDDSFIMPDHDVVIFGEWIVYNGTFTPILTQEIVNKKQNYSVGDIVTIKTTISNTNDFDIYALLLKNSLGSINTLETDSYSSFLDYINIHSIPANESVEVISTFEILDDDVKEYTNICKLLSASADDGYYLNTENDYSTSIGFSTFNISLTVNVVDNKGDILSNVMFRLYDNSELVGDAIATGVMFNDLQCNTTYYLKQVKTESGYVNAPVMIVEVDNNGIITIDDYVVINEDGNSVVNILNKKINMLPETGGVGNIPYIIIGLIIVITGSIVYIFSLKKEVIE